jgi:hypothetical protein
MSYFVVGIEKIGNGEKTPIRGGIVVEIGK